MTTTTATARQAQLPNPRAAEITFGIEIECFLPNNSVRIGGYHRGIELGGEFPAGWNAQYDASLRTTLHNYTGVEIVSPILKGPDGLAQIRTVANVLNRMRARVNTTCGFHVHIGVKSVAGTDYDDVADWIRRVLKLTAQHEMAFYGAAGTKRRYDYRYCKSLKNGIWATRKQKLNKKNFTADDLRIQSAGVDRYQLLNIAPAFTKGTVEFRAFSGTTDATKMVAWVAMSLAIATLATKRDTSFDTPRTSYAAPNAAGAMKRFFYMTGWTRGRKDYYKPACIVEGWIDDLYYLGKVKRELMRLARKYDA